MKDVINKISEDCVEITEKHLEYILSKLKNTVFKNSELSPNDEINLKSIIWINIMAVCLKKSSELMDLRDHVPALKYLDAELDNLISTTSVPQDDDKSTSNDVCKDR